MFIGLFGEFYMQVIQPLFEGDRKYVTIGTVLLLVWGIPRIPGKSVPFIVGGLSLLVLLGVILYMLYIRRLDREDDLVYEAGLEFALTAIPAGELPPAAAAIQAQAGEMLATAGLTRPPERLIEAAQRGLKAGASQRFWEWFEPRLDQKRLTRLGSDEFYDAYVRCFNTDLSFVPYLERIIAQRFGVEVFPETCLREVKTRIAATTNLHTPQGGA